MTKLQEQLQNKQALKNKNFINKINKEQQKAKTKRLKSLGSDPSLLFLPMASEMILQKLVDINIIFSNLESDIEQLNDDIEQYNTNQIGNKQNLISRKNALLNQINIVEKKINSINKILSQLSNVITTLQIIISTLKLLPLPTSPVPVPVGVILTAANLLEKLTNTIKSFNLVIKSTNTELNNVKVNLEDLKNQIKLIENNIENKIIYNNSNLEFEDILKQTIKLGIYNEIYKGFKFAIREENAINAPSVNNFKRHYAVAIDSSGIEVLKTDLSFTLEAQQLIEFLKLEIDKNNLKS